MYVSSARVASGALDIGRIRVKNTRTLLAPSISAASSTSREMLLKNCRRKKIAKLEMNKVGSMMPSSVSTRPRFLIRMKFGSRVKIWGIISEPRKIRNTASRPRQRRREKA